MKITNIEGHSFISEILSEDGLVIDCGVNKAKFAIGVSALKNVRVVGFEADIEHFKKLPNLANGKFFNKAVGASDEDRYFYKRSGHDGTILDQFADEEKLVRVQGVNLEKYIASLEEVVDLLKLDIEGAELEIFDNMTNSSFSKIKQITVEFHDFLDRSQIPLIVHSIGKAKAHGFDCLKFSHFSYGDILLVNRKFFRVSIIDKTGMVTKKYVRGVLRYLARKLHSSNS